MKPKFFMLLVWMCLPCIPIFAFQHSTKEPPKRQKHHNHSRKPKIELRFFWKNEQQQIYYDFERLKQNLARQNLQLLFATNAGMFSPSHSPQGLFVDSLKQLVPIRRDTTGYGNFYMQPNGIFLIDTLKKPHVITTQQYSEYEKKTLYATQSGPMLVIDNQINKLFKKGSANTYIRSVQMQGRG